MDAYDLMLAVAMLMAPPGTPTYPDAYLPAVNQAATNLGLPITLGCLDLNCVDVVRQQIIDMATWPELADSYCFPWPDLWYLEWNRKHCEELKRRIIWEADRAPELRRMLALAEWDYRVWCAILEAKAEKRCVYHRRQALENLRLLVGDEGYANLTER